MRWIGLVCLLVLVAVIVKFGKPEPLYYRQHPIELIVVDEETGEPIEGAVVVARWNVTGGSFNTYTLGALDIQEAVSDKNGNVLLPGFEKYERPWFSGEFFEFDEPTLIVYKYRYAAKRYYNRQSPARLLKRDHGAEMKWWGDPVLSLAKLPDDPEARFEKFRDTLLNPVKDVIPSLTEGCMWTKVKRMILEYDKQMREGEELGMYHWMYGAWYMPPPNVDGVTACPGGVRWIQSERDLERTK